MSISYCCATRHFVESRIAPVTRIITLRWRLMDDAAVTAMLLPLYRRVNRPPNPIGARPIGAPCAIRNTSNQMLPPDP
jgi:hypothetical protein